MTIGDFLAQAGFWKWVGMILIATALGNVRLVSIKKYITKDKETSK